MATRFHPSHLSVRHSARHNGMPAGNGIYRIQDEGKEYYVKLETTWDGRAKYVLYLNDSYVPGWDTVVYTWEAPDMASWDKLTKMSGDASTAIGVLSTAVRNLSDPEKGYAEKLLSLIPGQTVAPSTSPTPSLPSAPPLTPSLPSAPPSQAPTPDEADEPPKKKLTEQPWFFPTIAGGVILVTGITAYLLTRKR